MNCSRCYAVYQIERIAQCQIDSVLMPGNKVYLCYDHIQEYINDRVIIWNDVEPAFDYIDNLPDN